MNVTKEMLDSVCENLNRLEKDKKELADEMKDTIASFATSHDIDKKAVHKFYKEWKEVNKDRDTYVQVDLESDNLFQIAFPELV